ncbi:MAG: DUF1963 domain-containing protein [Bacteroidia bacterium]
MLVPAEIRQQLSRKAVIMHMRQNAMDHPETGSWFGNVTCSLPSETWPEMNGKPMFALCQINVLELPYCPPLLEDMAMITLFVAPQIGTNYLYPNGNQWLLRAYHSLDDLIPLAPVPTASEIPAVALAATPPRDDFPCWEDVNIDLPLNIAEHYYDHFSTSDGIKLGGWPNLVQTRVHWEKIRKFAQSRPEFVFQIDSFYPGNWLWGNSGVGYVGRGTAPGREDQWFLEWQST